MNQSFDLFHQCLDARIIGIMATDSVTEYIHGLDGSIVVCDSVEAMHAWLRAHDLDPASELDFVFYEDLIDDMCKEGISYHLDAGASEALLVCCAQDQRFHPEILHYTDDGTLFTSFFDPYTDDLDLLRTAINEFVIGYIEDGGVVSGHAHGRDSFALNYGAYERLAIPANRLEALAKGRLASLEFWLWMLREYDV